MTGYFRPEMSWVPDISTPLGYTNRRVDFIELRIDAILVDRLLSRPPGLKVLGKRLRVSGREVVSRAWIDSSGVRGLCDVLIQSMSI